MPDFRNLISYLAKTTQTNLFMLPKVNPLNTHAWSSLQKDYEQLQHQHLKQLFAQDDKRFQKFSAVFEDIL